MTGEGAAGPGLGGIAMMVVPGLAACGAVPVVLRAAGTRLARWPVPPAWAGWAGFVAVHALITVGEAAVRPGPSARVPLTAVLVCAAVPFWLPVLHPRRRLGDAGRCLYLYLAGPALDLPSIAVLARGDALGGILMTTSMLPVAFGALGVTWRWISREEWAASAAREPASPVRG